VRDGAFSCRNGVHTNLVKGADAPNTLNEATDPKWSGKLAVHEITNNSEGQMGLTYLTTLRRVMGDKKWDGLVDRLSQLTTTGYQCMPDMALNIGLGHSYLGFLATRACVSYQVEMQEMPIKLKMSEDVPYMATFAPTVGLVKGSKNQDWGEKAFNFAISEVAG
jgi:ABC-type Fe3+ transport system substrate-binding protein